MKIRQNPMNDGGVRLGGEVGLMKETERIKVFIHVVDGRTICICHAARKRCGRDCQRDEVTRDKFDQWHKTMKREKYGR